MNSKYKTEEKINVNKIFFEDSFIDLINKLSKQIGEYYRKSKCLLSESFNLFTKFDKNMNQIFLLNKNNNIYDFENNQELSKIINNINVIYKELKLISTKAEENLKIFMEKANTTFKEMKEKKNKSLEEIYTDYANKNSPKTIEQNKEFNAGAVNPFRLSDLSVTTSNSQNKIKERNKTINKTQNSKNNSLNNMKTIRNLINQMSNYNSIISHHSQKAKDNYIDLQHQILYEINKSINAYSSKSVGKKNTSIIIIL